MIWILNSSVVLSDASGQPEFRSYRQHKTQDPHLELTGRPYFWTHLQMIFTSDFSFEIALSEFIG